MIAVYIIIGVAVGAVVLYLLMDRRMDMLRIEGGKKDIALSMKTEQLAESTSRVRHLEAENKTLNARTESQTRELELVRNIWATSSRSATVSSGSRCFPRANSFRSSCVQPESSCRIWHSSSWSRAPRN